MARARQFSRIRRAVAHSSATFRYFRTASVPTTYGFELPAARFARRGRLTFEPSQSVWFDRMMSAPACCTMSSNRCADRTYTSRIPVRVEPGPAPERREVRRTVLADGNDHRERARRVTGRDVERHRRVASVSLWPSLATMSRTGFVPPSRSMTSQSAADMSTRVR